MPGRSHHPETSRLPELHTGGRPSQLHSPPIINLDKSTNQCLACSICLPFERTSLRPGPPAGSSSRITEKRRDETNVSALGGAQDADRPLRDAAVAPPHHNFEGKLHRRLTYIYSSAVRCSANKDGCGTLIGRRG